MTRKHLVSSALTLSLLVAASAPSFAQNVVDSVAAVVNENVISLQDFKDRVAFTIKNMRTSPTGSAREELEETQMDDLIDEELLRQYAEEKGYTIDDAQVNAAIANMEGASKQAPGSFKEFAGKYYETALDQVRTTVLRQMIIERDLRFRITVGEDEINRIVKGVVARQDELDEKELAQVFIPIADVNKAGAAKRTIDRLYAQLTEGAKFSEIARTYSRDRSAANGGEIGWFRGGELIPVIDDAVKNLKKGEISKPVQSSNGWHIFKVLDIREAPKPDMTPTKEINITQLYAPVDSTSGTPASVQNKKHVKSFKELKKDIANKEQFKDMVTAKIAESPLFFASGDMGWLNIDTLEKEVKTALEKAKAGTIVGPVTSDKGVYMFYINDVRETEPLALKNLRDRIRERLEARQADLAFRSLLRSLHRKAFIEKRI